MDFLRGFFRGIKNLIIWFPIIWKDRDFDNAYLLIILSKKLKRMSKIKSISYNYEKQQRKMYICSLLADRLIKDDYVQNLNKLDFWVDEFGHFQMKDLGPNNILKFWKDDNYWENMQQQDLKLLFKILERNLLYWWD